MPVVYRFMVQSFKRDRDGELFGEEPEQLSSPEAAIARAEALREKASGVLAYSWRGDMKTGEEGRLVVLMRSGVFPMHVLEQIYSTPTPY